MNPDPLESATPVVALPIDGKQCRTILDTGAVLTIVRRGLLPGPPPDMANLHIRGVSGDVAPAYGPRRASFQFGPVEVKWDVFEVDMSEDCLLGTDLMLHLRASVDIGYSQFVVRQRGPGRPLPLPMAIKFHLSSKVPTWYHFNAFLCIRSPAELRVPPGGEVAMRALLRSDWHPPARRAPDPPEDGPRGSGSSGLGSVM
jgi:hypothetical protein